VQQHPSPRRLPPLNAVRAFEAAARHLSFTRAADELFVTQGAVSHQVKLLEEWFGFLLFDRHKRELQLTRKGEEYLPAVRVMLNDLHVATRALLDEDDEHLLCVSVAESFAVNWLIDRLGRFAELHPDLDIRLASQNQIDDLGNVIGEEGPNWVDLRIRYGRGKWPGLQVTKLFDEEVFPVCSPDLIPPDQPVRSLEDLTNYTLIHDDMQMSWESWLRSAGYTQVISTKGPRFSHSHMALQAALNGSGIVLGRSVLALDHLQSGDLVRPLNISVPAEHSYYLLCQERMIGDAKVRAFTAWLLEEARAFNAMRASVS
jgi:LysR family glycine cleavage system transcriptional activator